MANKKEILMSKFVDKINEIEDEGKLKEISALVTKLNDIANVHDAAFKNIIDTISLSLTITKKGKLKKSFMDLIDGIDKVDKKTGEPKYSEELKTNIYNIFKQIDEISNRSFWDEFTKVLRGS